MRRRAHWLVIVTLVCVFGREAAAQSLGELSSTLPLENERLEATLTTRKLEAEIEKLESEIASLRAIDARTRLWTTWLTAGGSIFGAIVGGLFTYFVTRMGFRFSAIQKELELDRSAREEAQREQNERLSRLKLRQEREQARELHDLRLFQDLGHESHRARLAAAAVLLDRLKRLRQPDTSEDLTPLERTESDLITKVLVAVLKRSDEKEQWDNVDGDPVESAGGFESQSEAALRKYIADELVETLELRFSRDDPPKSFGSSPFADPRSFQKCDLTNVWWAFVDLRALDFFGSILTRASLRGAALQEAVFYEATLHEAVLRDADLRRANLMGADLRRADLRDADLREANLQGADLGGADLTGARLEGAVINVEAIRRFQATRWPAEFAETGTGGATVSDETYRPGS